MLVTSFTVKTQETPLVRNILNVNGCQIDDHSLGCVTPDESPFKMLCNHQGFTNSFHSFQLEVYRSRCCIRHSVLSSTVTAIQKTWDTCPPSLYPEDMGQIMVGSSTLGEPASPW